MTAKKIGNKVSIMFSSLLGSGSQASGQGGVSRMYRAKFDFNAEGPEELSVTQGELVASTFQENGGWLRVTASKRGANGRNETKTGLVPFEYLEVQAEPSAPPARRAPPPVPIAQSASSSGPDTNLAVQHAECPICYDELHVRPPAVFVGRNNKRTCSHFLHLDCAQSLLANGRDTCPICRKKYAKVVKVPDFQANPKEWFKCVDADGNGKLSKYEVLEVLQAILPIDHRKLEQNVDALWSRWDKDGSGDIDERELCDPNTGLLAYVRSNYKKNGVVNEPALTMSTREQWFYFWDEDNSGCLSKEEIFRALAKTFKISTALYKVQEMKDVLDAVWAVFDTDGSGEIDMTEFLQPDGLGESLVASLQAYNRGN